ncbi:Rep family protein, partial [Enterococcus faecium]|uniref:Rep family protein n=1 Tax=Enterococcus faecium TaxID=1352 RepID=UPI000C061DE8
MDFFQHEPSNHPVAISPLHDKDITEDVERKKPHFHVILSYKWNKSFEQIDEIARLLHAPIPQRLNSLTGAVWYLTQIANPDKSQNDSSGIGAYGGLDCESALSLCNGC